MRQAALAHFGGDRLLASVGPLAGNAPQVAAVAVFLAVDRRSHFERTLVQQALQLFGGCLSELGFSRAARWMRFRRVDADDPDLALAELERVAVDDAGMAAPRPAARKALVDRLRIARQEAGRIDQRRIGDRGHEDARQNTEEDERPKRGQPADRVAREPTQGHPVLRPEPKLLVRAVPAATSPFHPARSSKWDDFHHPPSLSLRA